MGGWVGVVVRFREGFVIEKGLGLELGIEQRWGKGFPIQPPIQSPTIITLEHGIVTGIQKVALIKTNYEEGRLQTTPAGHPLLATPRVN
jgi:hypothetical protein